MSLFGGNKLDICVLADQTKTDTKKIEVLRKSEILKAGRVFTMGEFVGKTEADIEDLFEPELFAKIINNAFALPALHRLTPTTLDDADKSTERLVKKAEAAFNVLPQEIPTYDHFTPSAWLIRNLGVLDNDDGGVKETLDRAETLFKAINAALARE